MRYRKPESRLSYIAARLLTIKQKISKQFGGGDVHERCWHAPVRLSSTSMLIKSLQIGFVSLILCVASAWAGPSSIQGIVTDAKGQPIKNAEIRIEPKNGGNLVATTKTDASGRYLSANLPTGTYRVTLLVSGEVKSSINNSTIKANKMTELNFALTPVSASQKPAAAKKAKHMVWVPPTTGSHMGGRWVEVEEGTTSGGAALNVDKVSAEALERQSHSMGSGGTGR